MIFFSTSKNTWPSIELVVSKEQNLFKFVKKGTKVKHKKALCLGTLHNSADWILIANLDKKYNFPLHIAYMELCLTSPFILIQPKRCY